ncbi:short-chain dehydrogenase TIC 32, chloroplastic isoform X3 [Gossypium hirsutum]|uniref:Short-chain dehydrogenase TIC 32, chloroplastic isoform X3 n=1 Tax=Gossypium hirsutum TaxID=3635 RepID=A0ABM2YTD2_GOSHI|nr:short-chain dehydrogenase TIC 32, chloroplastic isoform X3 [Gossypium hirsutum]
MFHHLLLGFGLIGASSGIGTETARVLALRGVHVIMGVRNVAAGRDVKEAIVKEIPTAKVDTMELDLSSIASVRKFAADFSSSGHPLNLLINNAGIMATPFMLSKDNIELQFATNHIGHFLLTNLLLDTMKKAARTSKREGRIINVSSEAHRYTYKEGIHFDKINDQSGYSNFAAYGQSKLANVLHANELAKRLKEDGVDITANSLHPGAIVTNLFRHMGPISGLVNIFGKIALKNVQQGLGLSSRTSCYLNRKIENKTRLVHATIHNRWYSAGLGFESQYLQVPPLSLRELLQHAMWHCIHK